MTRVRYPTAPAREFLLLLALLLIPVWAFPYVPTQDGPMHLENAWSILHYRAPGAQVLRDYYALSKLPIPTWPGHLIYAGLLALFPPALAEKTLLSAYVILFMVSFRYAVRRIRPDAVFLCFAAAPLVYNYPFHLGFFHFSLSHSVFFLAVAAWWSRRRWNARAILVLTALLTLLYFTHIFTLAVTLLTLGVLTCWSVLLEFRSLPPSTAGPSPRVFTRLLARRLAPLILAALPALALLCFMLFSLQQADPLNFHRYHIWSRLLHFRPLTVLVSYNTLELVPAAAALGLWGGLLAAVLSTRRRTRRPLRSDGFLWVLLISGVIYILAPDYFMSRAGKVLDRLSLYILFLVLLYLAAHPHTPRRRQWAALGGVAVTTLLLGFHLHTYARCIPLLDDYNRAAFRIPPGRTVLPLSLSDCGPATGRGAPPSRRTKPFLHALGYAAARRPLADLANHEGHIYYYPLTYRTHLDPYTHIGPVESPETESLDFTAYPARTGGQVDYVLLWGWNESRHTNAHISAIMQQLREHYTREYVSPLGHACLYRARTAAAAARP
ncbi:MAG: hypothetical protein JW951_08630 [Lentisphaerae bacterium]|nr:hypothetical protein [Lentisphaerota bacterium]